MWYLFTFVIYISNECLCQNLTKAITMFWYKKTLISLHLNDNISSLLYTLKLILFSLSLWFYLILFPPLVMCKGFPRINFSDRFMKCCFEIQNVKFLIFIYVVCRNYLHEVSNCVLISKIQFVVFDWDWEPWKEDEIIGQVMFGGEDCKGTALEQWNDTIRTPLSEPEKLPSLES